MYGSTSASGAASAQLSSIDDGEISIVAVGGIGAEWNEREGDMEDRRSSSKATWYQAAERSTLTTNTTDRTLNSTTLLPTPYSRQQTIHR